MKKILLQNTVSDFDAFKPVKTAEQLEIAKGNNPLPYDKYTSLLWSVASSHGYFENFNLNLNLVFF